MKAFLLNYSNVLEQNYVHAVLNHSNSIENWLSPFPNSVLVVSRLTSSELGAVLHSHFGDNLFLIVEVNAYNCAGWLPPEFWGFINNPQPVALKPLFPPPIARPILPKPPFGQS